MAEIGSGNGTSIPTEIDTGQTYVNVSNPRPDSSSRVDAELVNDLLATVIAMEVDLFRTRVIDARTYPTFTEAVAAAANGTLFICSSVTLDANTIIPSTVSLLVTRPGIINANGKTLTINGPVVGAPMHQWLSGFAYGTNLTITNLAHLVNPIWYGGLNSIGIGTANPGAILEIKGNGPSHSGNTNAILKLSSADGEETTFLRDSDAGNKGILRIRNTAGEGLTTGYSLISLEAPPTNAKEATIALMLDNGEIVDFFHLKYGPESTTWGLIYIRGEAAGVWKDFCIQSQDLFGGPYTEHLRIKLPEGYIGIGTYTPQYPWDFHKSVVATSGDPVLVKHEEITISPPSNSAAVVRATNLEVPTAANSYNHNSITNTHSRLYHYGTGVISVGEVTNSKVVNMSTGTITTADAGLFSVHNEVSGGTMTNAYALRPIIYNAAGATMGTAVGVYINWNNSGTINTGFGVYIQSIVATNSYGIYQEGSNNINYFAGKVGIGTGISYASAILEISSTTKGFLPPKMTAAQRNAITSPTSGLMIYNIDSNKLNFYNGAAWEQVTSA